MEQNLVCHEQKSRQRRFDLVISRNRKIMEKIIKDIEIQREEKALCLCQMKRLIDKPQKDNLNLYQDQ